MKQEQNNTQPQAALLRSASSGDAPVKNSLCCVAAGIIASPSVTPEALIPHEKLRKAAAPDATLIAHTPPPAQPAEGDKPFFCCESFTEQTVFEPIQIEDRAEFEEEFPVPEGMGCCGQRGKYICAPGTNTSDALAREHYGYRAGFAGWVCRSWKRAILDTERPGRHHLAKKVRQEEA